jgi:hypothetical protein
VESLKRKLRFSSLEFRIEVFFSVNKFMNCAAAKAHSATVFYPGSGRFRSRTRMK